MASIASTAGAAPPARLWSASTVTALVLLAAALLIRAPRFGDPNLHVDETFYLQVGELMWSGALPYVDVWDRKPIGLFLLYGAIRLLGGDGILQYQLVATGFAFATALVIAQIARRMGVTALGAGGAGVVYLASLAASSGYGGQSPVFYNLLVTIAALLTLRALEASTPRRLTLFGTAAMLLCGIAIQIKYTVLFEGCFLGLMLVWRAWNMLGPAAAIRYALLFGCCGLGPTAAALAYYAAIGELQAFWFANFTSIGLRPAAKPIHIQGRLLQIAVIQLPLLICVGTAYIAMRRQEPRAHHLATYRFVLGWAAVAVFGFLLFGTFYRHYALPLLVPLSLAAAPIFDRRPVGTAAAAFVAFWAALLVGFPSQSPQASQKQIAHLTSAVTRNLNGGCLFMFDGPPAVDYLSRGCHLTRFVFPYHLSLAVEETGLGVDPVLELRNVLKQKPAVIVSASIPVMEPNRKTRALLYHVLEREYQLVGSYPANKRMYQVYRRASES
jgi:hypothetical protein